MAESMDFRKWRETRSAGFWWNLSITATMAYMSDKLNYNLGTQVYTLGNKTIDFTEFDPDHPVDRNEAMAYFAYLRFCKRKGIEPGPYVQSQDYDDDRTDGLLDEA